MLRTLLVAALLALSGCAAHGRAVPDMQLTQDKCMRMQLPELGIPEAEVCVYDLQVREAGCTLLGSSPQVEARDGTMHTVMAVGCPAKQ